MRTPAVARAPGGTPSTNSAGIAESADSTRSTTATINATRARPGRDRAHTVQAMSELVADLEAKHYLARRHDPADRRVRIIEFTPRGRAAIRTALGAFEEIERELADRLGAGRIASLRSVLSDLVDGEEPDRPDR